MYFVRNNEEIHLSFKNSEKLRTQALTITSADNSDIICITKTKNILICLHANANKFMTDCFSNRTDSNCHRGVNIYVKK